MATHLETIMTILQGAIDKKYDLVSLSLENGMVIHTQRAIDGLFVIDGNNLLWDEIGDHYGKERVLHCVADIEKITQIKYYDALTE